MTQHRGMVIVGAGECGARAAFALRENGYSGPVDVLGEEEHRPYERPPLSKGRPGGAVPLKEIATQAQWDSAEISLSLGTKVTEVDRADRVVHLADGRLMNYDKLLFATGARARRLPLATTVPVATLRTMSDAQHISSIAVPGSRVAIIGAGLIGLELAARLRAGDVDVTIIEVSSAALGRAVPPELAARLVQRHRDEGVRFEFDAEITAITDGTITLLDGSQITADLTVAAIGAEPETGLAEQAGLEVRNGITVNVTLATSDQNIFAAGDCCNFPSPRTGAPVRLESWRNALDQGEHAAANMLGAAREYQKTPWFWSEQYDLTLQVAGLPQPGRPFVRRQPGSGATLLFQLDDDGRLVSASGLGPSGSVAKEIRIAELLIERGTRPDPRLLADTQSNLKNLLRTG